jgi:hypothetical protein
VIHTMPKAKTLITTEIILFCGFAISFEIRLSQENQSEGRRQDLPEMAVIRCLTASNIFDREAVAVESSSS